MQSFVCIFFLIIKKDPHQTVDGTPITALLDEICKRC